jgi:hypothetical protein
MVKGTGRLKKRLRMLKTRICELFGIEYQIIFAGMGGIALAKLAAALSKTGGDLAVTAKKSCNDLLERGEIIHVCL